MLFDADILPRIVATTPLWPTLGAVLISLRLVGRTPPSERLVARVSQTVLWLGFACAWAGVLLWLLAPGVVDLRLGYWYQAAEYEFPLVLRFDGLSAALSLFGKTPDALGRQEALLLVALLPDPKAAPEALARRACTLSGNADCGHLRHAAADMLGAARAYQANLTAINVIRDTVQRALELGK